LFVAGFLFGAREAELYGCGGLGYRRRVGDKSSSINQRFMSIPPVLYAEDEENDVFLMQRAFRKAGIANPLQTASDGAEAIRYLEAKGDPVNRQDRPLPCLVLLDLNLPRRSGLEVLKWIREEPKTRELPVIILTSSNQHSDIAAAYELGANGYLVKPPSSEKLLELVAMLRDACLQSPMTADHVFDLKGSVPPPAP
jgi:CheY-like chemotaxis protein